MSHAFCSEGKHYPETLIATSFIDEDGNDARIDVQQDGEGNSLNRFVDGVVGVPDLIQEEAELDESPVCWDHPGCEVTWDHHTESDAERQMIEDCGLEPTGPNVRAVRRRLSETERTA